MALDEDMIESMKYDSLREERKLMLFAIPATVLVTAMLYPFAVYQAKKEAEEYEKYANEFYALQKQYTQEYIDQLKEHLELRADAIHYFRLEQKAKIYEEKYKED